MLNVLVGTLYSGENEIDQCVDALNHQHHCHRSHFIIEHMAEKAAHDQLHKRFMHNAGEYDLFLKLDADMILTGPDKLGAAVAKFEASPELDHAVFTVHDWMTDSAIVGIHMYRNRVRWVQRDDELFADTPPEMQGVRCDFTRGDPSPLADHSPDPTPVQAFHYGLHRGLKAFQNGLEVTCPELAFAQWRVLKRVWRHFERVRDRRLGLALMAVDHALTHLVTPDFCNYTNPRFWQTFSMYEAMTPDQMYTHLRPMWQRPVRREVTWLRTFMRQLARRRRKPGALPKLLNLPTLPTRRKAG